MYLFLQLFLVASFLFFLYKRSGRKAVHPPGPPGLPIIGNLRDFFSSCPHLYLHELSKNYGPLMSFKLGSVPTLVVSSAKMAKEMIKTHDQAFSNRPMFAAIRKLSYNGFDVAFAPYGDDWRELKRLCVLHFFCSKKVHSFSSIREEEVYRMTQKILQFCAEGKLVDFNEMFICLTSTIVCRTAFGRSHTRLDSSRAARLLREAQGLFVMFCFSDYFPSFGWLDKLTGVSARLHKLFMELDGFYQQIIDDHLNAPKPESGQEDIVDVLLMLQRDKLLSIDITMNHIKGIFMNIFLAGTDTTSVTLVWGMTELMKNPGVMKRVQEEVRTLMRNKSRDTIKDEDVEELAYLKAVVKETMRLHPASPLLVPRATTQKCSIEGYEIEANTLVFVNSWTIGRDPECWDRPEEFNPDRFMCEKPVDFKGQHFELIPFGSGRRICPGIQMAVAMVELTLANIVYAFDWEVPVGMEKHVLDTDVLPGITPYKKTPLCLLAKQAPL